MSTQVARRAARGGANAAYWAAVSLTLLAVPVLAVSSLRQKSATFDEPNHLVYGLAYLASGDYGIAVDHPPLARLTAAVAAHLSGAPIYLTPGDLPWTPDYSLEATQRVLFRQNDADRLLFWGRLPTVLSLVLLCVAVYVWATHLWGKAGGLIALLVAGFSPSMLAHGRLVTTDVPVTFYLFLGWTLLALGRQWRLATPLLAGLVFGLAALCKHSALLALPCVAIVLGLCAVLPEPRVSHGRLRRLGDAGLAITVIVATVVLEIWLFYGAPYRAGGWARPGAAQAAMRIAAFRAANVPPQRLWASGVTVAERFHVLPEPYLLGLRFTLSNMQRSTYFWGRHRNQASVWYFPVAFLIKTPIGALLLIAVGVAVLSTKRRPLMQAEHLYACGFPALYALSALFSPLNIGERHILPIYPFLFVLAGGAAHWWAQRGWRRALCLGALGWIIAATLWIHPDYLAYFNEGVGGPLGGFKYLGDSNLDWGQDLKRLHPWMERHGIGHIKLGYFGTALPEYYGISYESLPSYGAQGAYANHGPIVAGDDIAVSASCLQGIYFPQSVYRWLSGTRPIATIGYSIYLYHIDKRPK